MEVSAKKRKKAKNNSVRSAMPYIAGLIVLLTAIFFWLNDSFFNIPGVPTSYDVVRFFGLAPEPYAELSEGEASVSFIDVGQGDCELIRCGGYNILIDCGEKEYSDTVAGFLKYSGVRRLDLVIVTHPHTDHYGGMYEIFKRFDVGLVIVPELPEDMIPYGITYNRFMQTMDYKNIPHRFARTGERFILGDNTALDIVAPIFNDYPILNNCSIAARFVHGENSFLFTGDLQEDAELDLVESGVELGADVIKVGHHGSAGSSCAKFLEEVSPRIAVFETGAENYYGHPRSEVLDRLSDAGCETAYSTANNGNIVIVSDGVRLRVLTEREQAFDLAG